MSKKRKIFISIATKWSIRNLIVTKILDEVAIKYEIVLFVSATLIKSEYGPLLKRFECIVVDPYPEKLSKRIFRQLKKAFIFNGANINTEKIWKKYVARPLYQKIGDYFISFLLFFINFKWLFNQVDKLEWYLTKDQRFDTYFKKYSPKYLMVSLLNTPLDESLIGSAIETNTEIRYLLMSWDHLTTKVVLNNNFSVVYLWTEINKYEMLELYDSYKVDMLRVVGAPQLTVYGTLPQVERELFLSLLGIDNKQNIIYYSAAPVVRHATQAQIVLELLNFWDFGNKPIHILFKIHPLDKLDDYKILKSHSNITLIDSSTCGLIKNVLPEYNEILFNRDLIYFSRINLNIYSSVTLEAFLLNRPVIHIAYEKILFKNTIPCKEYYNFSHFQVITKSGASSIAFSLEELMFYLNVYIDNPLFKKDTRERFNLQFWGNISSDFNSNLINELIS